MIDGQALSDRENFRHSQRWWRTRPDPLADFQDDILQEIALIPHLKAAWLLRRLQARYPGRIPPNVLRTLQRRLPYYRMIVSTQLLKKEIAPKREAQTG